MKFFLSRKAAIELSMNFIIGLVLGVVLFGFGLVFMAKIMGAAKDIPLPNNYQYLVEGCVSDGKQVCIPEFKKDPVKTGQAIQYGVVVNNNVKAAHYFKIFSSFSYADLKDGSSIDPSSSDAPDPSKWMIFNTVSLDNNEHKSVDFFVRPPKGTKSGQYTFNINVCYDSADNINAVKCQGDGTYQSLYGATQQINVEVK